MKPELTAERLREVLDYDPETGVFRWRITRGSRAKVGQVAGSINEGYIAIQVDGRAYKSHRLAWLYIHGIFPPDQIDHTNGIVNDNRMANLRLASNGQNKANACKPRNNTSGYKGVHWKQDHGKWLAHIAVNRRKLNLGYFDTREQAHAAYCDAAQKFFGEFWRAS